MKKSTSVTKEVLHNNRLNILSIESIANLGYWEWNSLTKEVYWSPGFYRILEYEAEEFVPSFHAFIARVHPDDKKAVNKALETIINDNTSLKIDFKIILPDGTIRYVCCASEVPEKDAEGNVIRLFGFIQNITEYKTEVIDKEGWEKVDVQTILDTVPINQSGSAAAFIYITKLKQAEDVVYQANLINDISDAIFSTDQEYRIKSWNAAAEKIYGWKVKEVLGKNIRELLQTEYKGLSYEEVDKIMVEEGELRTEAIHKDRYGNETNVYLNVCVLKDKNGEIAGTLGIIRDITEMKREESKFIEANRKAEYNQLLLEAVVQQMPAGIIISNADGTLVRRNEEMDRIWRKKRDPEENLYNHGYIAFHPDGRKYTLEDWPLYRSIINEEVIMGEEMIVLRGDGTKGMHLVSSTPIKNSEGKIVAGVIINIDITDCKSAQEELKSQKNELEAIIENMSDGLGIFDSKGNLIMMNAVAKSQFYNSEYITKVGDICKNNRFLDMNGEEILPENMPVPRALRGENVKNAQILIRRPDREIFTEFHAKPVYDDKGNLVMVVTSFCDVTSTEKNRRMFKAHQEELLKIEKEKNEALEKVIEMKDEFLSVISHEFKTPLTVISSSLQIMKMYSAKNNFEKALQYADNIRRNVLRQMRLVNNLLDITCTNAGTVKLKMANYDIVFLTRAIIESINEYVKIKGVNVYFRSKLKQAVIGIDEEKYERILLNLLSNAMKFTPQGKSIYVNVFKKNGSVVIQVMDEGIGIPKDKQTKIFERFGQVDSSLSRKAEGVGIGLSLVKTFVNAMNGIISLESAEGKGSCFTISFPMQKTEESQEVEYNNSRIVVNHEIEFSDIYLS